VEEKGLKLKKTYLDKYILKTCAASEISNKRPTANPVKKLSLITYNDFAVGPIQSNRKKSFSP
jgi:hypothetical protein